MMKITKKSLLKTALCFVLTAVILCGGITASAANTTVYSDHGDIPYETYTYWNTGSGFEAVYTKPLYSAPKVLNAQDLGLADFKTLYDVSVSKDGFVFVLDGDGSKIIVLDNEYKLYKEITAIGEYTFAGAKGIFAADNGNIYIADSSNARVLVCDKEGNFKNILTLPDSPLIPEDFVFSPLKLTVDRSGYTYVLSDGSYYGAILYSPEGEFLSFYGANTVETGIGAAIAKLWENLTMTNEKRAQQISKLPYQFTDMYVDNNNFIYTATGKTGENKLQTGVIKMLSPGGVNILPSSSVAFGEKDLISGSQDIAGLAVDDYGFIYTYDTKFSRIYLYDSECNMICAFGGGWDYGRQDGSFQRITAIDLKGDDVIVTDGSKNTITIFECNEYGKNLKALQRKTLDGDYLGCKAGWQEVNIADSNNQLAYVGLAKAAYTEGNYKEAMEIAKTAYDKKTYSQAFTQVRAQYLRNNFTWIFILVILLIVLGWLGLRYFKKKNIKLVKDVRTSLFLQATFHPAAVFTDIKQKKLSSTKCGVIALALFYISAATQQMFGSFVFVDSTAGSFNSILLLLRTVGLVLLWTITNWAVCSLMGGIGKTKEIFTVVTYSLMPMIVGNFAYTILTHFLVPEEAAFMSVIMTVLQLYSIVLIIMGSIIIHDISFGKFVLTALLTFLGIAIVIFVGVLIVILVQQLLAFFSTVTNEIIYR